MKSLFVVLIASVSWSANANIMQIRCIDQIAEKVCLVGAAKSYEERLNRPCLHTPEEYKQKIAVAFKNLPEEIKPIACHIKKIFIEKNFYATGYAGDYAERVPLEDYDEYLAFRRTGWIIGLSEQKVFKEGWDFESFLAHKDQTLFGLKLSDPIAPDFPRLQVLSSKLTKQELFIHDVLIHEIGHLLDMANKITKYKTDHCFSDDNGNWIEGCLPIVYGAFSAYSWGSDFQPRPDSRFFDRRLCFYNDCKHIPDWQSIPLARADEFYKELIEEGNFISTYAATDPMEDFAETMAYYFLLSDESLDISLYFPKTQEKMVLSGDRSVLIKKWGLRAKLDFAFIFLNSNLEFSPDIETFWVPKNSPASNFEDGAMLNRIWPGGLVPSCTL